MNEELWKSVDDYISKLFVKDDAVLKRVLESSLEGGLPQINVAANQGKFLQLLATVCGARRILEVGTLGGYSTLWLARALPKDGKLVTLEVDANCARVARSNIAASGIADRIELIEGPAADSMKKLIDGKCPPFDFIFIDADKPGYPEYYSLCRKLSRIGTCIIADNVVREGTVIQADHPDPRVQGVRQFNKLVAEDPFASATAIQTVGCKGYDGFTMAVISGGDDLMA